MKITTEDGIDVTDLVRQVYDMATNSMDYGSGFLSTEEMEYLYALAIILDADDRIDVLADVRKMRFNTLTDEKHAYQPDREDPRLAHCTVCGQRGPGVWRWHTPTATERTNQ